MEQPKRLNQNDIDLITEQFNVLIGTERNSIGFDWQDIKQIAEFERWHISNITSSGLEDSTFSNQWEHIWSLGGGHFASSRSCRDENDAPEVFHFSIGERPRAINNGLQWIEAHGYTASSLRLLLLTEYHLEVIWFRSKETDFICVTHLPFNMSALKAPSILSWKDLRHGLRLEPKVRGVLHDRVR